MGISTGQFCLIAYLMTFLLRSLQITVDIYENPLGIASKIVFQYILLSPYPNKLEIVTLFGAYPAYGEKLQSDPAVRRL